MGLDKAVYDEFTPIPELDSINVVHIACGYQHSIALSGEGAVYFWGTFSVDIEPVKTPIKIKVENEKIIYCTCSSDSVLLLSGTILILKSFLFFF